MTLVYFVPVMGKNPYKWIFTRNMHVYVRGCAISFDYTRYNVNRNKVLEYLVYIFFHATAPVLTVSK